MSKVQDFLKVASEDKELQKKVSEIMEGNPEELSDKIVALAKESGFEITFDEFLNALREQEGEISDNELDNIAGGFMREGSILDGHIYINCPICGRRIDKRYGCQNCKTGVFGMFN